MELRVPGLLLRLLRPLASGVMGKEEVVVVAAAVEILRPLRMRCVEGWRSGVPGSHQGQVFLRCSQSSSLSFCVQFVRLLAELQGWRRRSQRCAQGWVETFRPATHMVGFGGVGR